MKKICYAKLSGKFSGFSLSEVLITLLILGLVATLGVPTLGKVFQQRLNKPVEASARHGIFECYYDAEGRLVQHTKNNTDNKSGETSNPGEACYFTAPNANYIVVQAVGSGGNGYDISNLHAKYNSSASPNKVEMDAKDLNNFKTFMENAPQWVRDKWNTYAPTISYTITSTMGSGGDGDQQETIDVSGSNIFCASLCLPYPSEKCPPGCKNVYKCPGGNSGNGWEFTKNIQLKYYPDKNYESTENSITVAGTTYSAGSAGSGVPGKFTWNNDGGMLQCIEGTNGTDAIYTPNELYPTIIQSKKGGFTSENPNKQGEPGRSGSVNVNGNTTKISYEDPVVKYSNIIYGEAGEPGDVVTRMFETIPANAVVKIVPGRNGSRTTVQIKKENSNTWSNLIVADAGSSETGFSIYSKDFIQNDTTSIPDEIKKAIEGKISPFNVKSQFYDSKVKDLVEPGKGGAGTYPLLFPNNVNLVRKICGRVITTSAATGPDNNNCIENFKRADNDTSVCTDDNYGTSGNPGAVVITW